MVNLPVLIMKTAGKSLSGFGMPVEFLQPDTVSQMQHLKLMEAMSDEQLFVLQRKHCSNRIDTLQN